MRVPERLENSYGLRDAAALFRGARLGFRFVRFRVFFDSAAGNCVSGTAVRSKRPRWFFRCTHGSTFWRINAGVAHISRSASPTSLMVAMT
jgi:hypothetical protein